MLKYGITGIFIAQSVFWGKDYELTLALLVPSYGAQERTRAAKGGWNMGSRLFRIRRCASSAFWVSLAYFSAALKSLHQGKPQIRGRMPSLRACKPLGQSCSKADFARPHNRFAQRGGAGFVALILHASTRGRQNQLHFKDISDF